MPGTSESQVVERLSKLNTNVRDSVKEIEELLKKDTGGLLNKQALHHQDLPSVVNLLL
jgi:hypothetical protein